jgi:hypothetical protein
MDNNYVTVVYKIVDRFKWGCRNPLQYNHDGLEAVVVRMGNTVDEFHELKEKENE